MKLKPSLVTTKSTKTTRFAKAIANDGNVLVADYVILASTFVQPAIIYPPFGQSNFHLRLDVINIFLNHQNIRFFGKLIENPHEHIQAFLILCEVINHEQMSIDSFQMCLFLHILRDNAGRSIIS